MQPVLALVGRPNVGKSTLFNRLTRTRDALVADIPGLTRDRQYGEGTFRDISFIAIDTGGISGRCGYGSSPGHDGHETKESSLDALTVAQALQAIEEATVCLLLVDARAGLAPDDTKILHYLRKAAKSFVLVVNKVDGADPQQACAEFHELGVAPLFPVAATQGRGVESMLEACLAGYEALPEAPKPRPGIQIAVAGRPNVGKSTLINRMLGEDRVLVCDQPGTTRDSLCIPFEHHGQAYTLIDTAGIRRRGKTVETVEKFSVVKSLQAIRSAQVALLVMDARSGIVEQDLHLLGFVIETGRALVIALNKWDGMEHHARARIRDEISRRLGFVDFASLHLISALHGTGVGDLYHSIDKAYAAANKELGAGVLTRILERAVINHQPPISNGRRIRLRYAHAGGQNPPTVVIHGKQTEKLPGHYRRYLEKTFRSALQLEGTPIRIELRSDENPFLREEQHRSPRQIAQKRRIANNRKGSRRRRRR